MCGSRGDGNVGGMKDSDPGRAALAFAGGAAGGFLAGRLFDRERVQFARLAGSSIAAPSAAAWITDLLNAAYYRRAPDHRDVDDLRLTHAILTTFWWRHGQRRIAGRDVVTFHRAFGRDRFRARDRSPRGTLSRTELMVGARRLFGNW